MELKIFAIQMLTATPVLVISAIAMGIAVFTWKSHARVSLFTLVAFALLVMEIFLGAAFQSWIIRQSQVHADAESVAAAATLAAVMGWILRAGFLTLVTLAIFSGRRRTAG